MATLIDMLFFIQLIAGLVCIGFPLYNIMNWNEPIFKLQGGFLFFIGYCICYFIAFICVLTNPEQLIYHPIFTFETWTLVIALLFLIIGIIKYLETIDEQAGPLKTLKG